MPATDPLTEVPDEIEAGNSLALLLTYSDYDPDDWSLEFVISNGSDMPTRVAATTSGESFAVTLTPAMSAALLPGEYSWATYATQSGQRKTCDSGSLYVAPNLAAPPVKSYAQTQVENLQAVMATFNTTDRLTVEIGTGIKYTRANVNDYRKQLVYWESRLASEKAKAAARRGDASPRRIGIEFAA